MGETKYFKYWPCRFELSLYAFELGDDNGVLLGLNAENASMCVLDLFNTKRYKNANIGYYWNFWCR